MRRFKAFGLAGVLLFAGSLSVRADVWDMGPNNDDTPNNAFVRNGLAHGTDQIHDLAAKAGVADHDWFLLSLEAYSSYIVVVDGLTSDLAFSFGGVSRRDRDNPATVLQTGLESTSTGYSIRMPWQNTGDTHYELLNIHSTPGAGGEATICSTTCDANDQYNVRLFDTTYLIPRFNNANSQITVLMVQNGSKDPVEWTANYWSVAGTLLKQVPGTLEPRQTAVVNLSTIPELQGQTGSITITHTGGFGGLATKTVALEPATGFSFDTPGTYRAR